MAVSSVAPRGRAVVLVAAMLVGILVVAAGSSRAGAVAPPVPSGCGSATVRNVPSTDTPKALTDASTTQSSVGVSAGTAVVHDVDVLVEITHPNPTDLDVKLVSPSGRQVVLTTDNGGANDDVFAETRFDDEADPGASGANLVTDATYADGVAKATLVPEGALSAFVGEPASGTWSLQVTDDTAGSTGTLLGWTLELQTVEAPPQQLARTVTFGDPGVVTNGTPLSRETGIGLLYGPIESVELTLQLPHGYNADLEITLTSPEGTVVTLTTDNGGSQADGYGNVRFADDAGFLVTDVNFASPPTAVVPEEAFGAFRGESPLGGWTLDIVDDAGGDDGTFQGAELVVRTASCPPAPAAPPRPGGDRCGAAPSYDLAATGMPKAILDNTTVTSSIAVGGPVRVWDVDVTVDIAHDHAEDLDITLIAPGGQQIRLAHDLGGAANDVFRNVRFDDDADPDGPLLHTTNDGVASDTRYRSEVSPRRLTPMDGLGVLEGTAWSGTWTLQVSDDDSGISGQLLGWTLHLRGTQRSPIGGLTTWAGQTPIGSISEGGVTAPIANVSGLTAPITGIALDLAVDHPASEQLDITLTSPAGTVVTLTTDNGGSNAVLAGTRFMDGAAQSVINTTLTSTPFELRPEEPLSALLGEPANGAWLLNVTDDTAGTTGTIDSWSLRLETGVCNQDPVVGDDAYAVAETASTSVAVAQGVLANDSDADGDALMAVLSVAPTHGDLLLAPNGSFLYAPDPRYRGVDTFRYDAIDPFGAGPNDSALVTLTVGKPVCSPPGPFTDVPATHSFCSEILWMANDGITQGYQDGSFKPSSVVTRQAMAAFLYRTKYPSHSPAPALPTCASPPFSDVPVSHAFCSYIQWMKVSGVGGGYPDGTFRPAATITRQAMAAFLYRLEKGNVAPPACSSAPFTDVPVTNQFCPYISWMVGEGIANGYSDGSFKPGAGVTRQAMAAFIERFVHRPPG